MKTGVEKLTSNRVKIDFEIEPERFEEGLAAAYRIVAKRVNIQGFRRGKAPRKVIEMHYGESVFYEDAIDHLFPEAYEEAIREHGLVPVDRPEFELTSVGKGEPLAFTVTVYVRPDVTLGAYRGLPIAKDVTAVTEDDVKAEIERAREGAATYRDIEDRPVRAGDRATIDYKGFINGVPFEGGESSGYALTVGDGRFIPGFEDQLVGAEIGADLKIRVTFPEDYRAEELRGKPAEFEAKVTAISERELPELDDEFAKDVSECETLSEYRERVRGELRAKADERDEQAFESALIEAAADGASAEIPDRMIEDRIDSMVRDFRYQLMYQGLDLEGYFKHTGQTEERLRDSMRGDANRFVLTQLTLSAIATAEGIEPSEEDVDGEIADYARRRGAEAEKIKADMGESEREYFIENARVKRVLDLLKSEAVAPPEASGGPEAGGAPEGSENGG